MLWAGFAAAFFKPPRWPPRPCCLRSLRRARRKKHPTKILREDFAALLAECLEIWGKKIQLFAVSPGSQESKQPTRRRTALSGSSSSRSRLSTLSARCVSPQETSTVFFEPTQGERPPGGRGFATAKRLTLMTFPPFRRSGSPCAGPSLLRGLVLPSLTVVA